MRWNLTMGMRRTTGLALLAAAAVMPGTLRAGSSRYLFFDPALVRETHGASIRVNRPLREDRVMTSDQPWEQMMITFYTTVRDEGGRLRMWYICRDRENRPNVAYAESTDGLNWNKPKLGVCDYEGSTANNLVGLGSLEGAVYRDPHGAGDEQYIYVSNARGGVFRFTSPDGLRWKRDADPLARFSPDTQTVTFWDEIVGKYRVYTRGKTPKGPGEDTTHRLVVLLEADSLAHPLRIAAADSGGVVRPGLPVMIQCDVEDPPDVDVYTNSIQPYPLDPHWYVGFPAFYRRFNHSAHFNDGRTEVQFVGSRDGVTWHRYGREVYAGPGQAGPQSGSMVFMGTGLVVRGDEIWQYGTRYRTTHGDKPGRAQQTDGAIYRFVQRVDGFVSLDTDNAAGTARTRPVKVTGRRLLLNLDTGALGAMQVGLLDADGRPLPGFSAESCRRLEIDSTAAAVTWADGGDLSALRGKEVAIEFRSHRTKLYSFRFED